MLYLFFGEDTFRSRRKLNEFTGEIFKQSPRPSFSLFTSESFLKPAFEELLRTKSLFAEKQVVVCESVLQESETADFICKNLKSCADSENIFIFWEEESKLPSAVFKKYAEEINEFKTLFPREIKIWLEEEAENKKIILPANAREKLIRRAGGN